MKAGARLVRRVAWVLLLSMGASLASAQETPFERAMRERRFADAAQIARRAMEESPQDSVAAFDLARALARAGELEASLAALLESARRGYAGVRSLEADAHLEAVRSHPRFGEVQRIVSANAAARFERFRAAAERAEPSIVLPPRHDPAVPAPLVVALHGSGGTGAQMADAWRGVAAKLGAVLVAPDALRPQPGTAGYSWVFRDEAEWLVLRAIDRANERFAIGPVILTGFSQGANIVFMLGQSHSGRFAGAIPVGGHYEPDVAEPPRDGHRPRWVLLTGARDPSAHTYDDAQRAFAAAGMAVRKTKVPGLGHEMPHGPRGERMLTEAVEWILSGGPAPESRRPRQP